MSDVEFLFIAEYQKMKKYTFPLSRKVRQTSKDNIQLLFVGVTLETSTGELSEDPRQSEID